METALGWLGDVFRFLLSLVPRLLIVRATHRAVKFARGKHARVLLPGLHFYWPLVTEVEIVPVIRQTVDLVPQYLTTADGAPVAVSGIVVYEVDDVLRLLTECFDYDAMIRSFSLAAIKRVVANNDFALFYRPAERKPTAS
jgi:regulator of protease activity HflC (stomatin/prohibitin superfamily)